MNNLSLFVDKDTPIQRLNPLTKIVYVFAAVATPMLLQKWWIFLFVMAISICVLIYAKAIKQVIPLVLTVSILLLSIVIIQSLFGVNNQTVLWQIGTLTIYKEGFMRSMSIVLNVLNLILAFGIFILTTKPSTITEAITSWGMSPKVAYVFGSVFQIIPEFGKTLSTIMDAQRSRGVETEGNLFIRLKAIIPLISPVIMNSLVNTKERAIALEVRGFSIQGKRTYLNDIRNTKTDLLIDTILLTIVGLALVWRITSWLL